VVLDGEHARKRIELPTKESLGKSFDGDIVVVKVCIINFNAILFKLQLNK